MDDMLAFVLMAMMLGGAVAVCLFRRYVLQQCVWCGNRCYFCTGHEPADWRRTCWLLMTERGLKPWEIRKLTLPEIALYLDGDGNHPTPPAGATVRAGGIKSREEYEQNECPHCGRKQRI
jgi:hypothetical protein